jgi:beta-glucosidase
MSAFKYMVSLSAGAMMSMLFTTVAAQNTASQKEEAFDYGADIEAIIEKMSVEEKVGQMTQINIDVISEGEIFNLVEPHTLDAAKFDSAINHYYVGSILNAGGHAYTKAHWEELITEIQRKAVDEGNHIPILYGIDAIHGVNYTVGATLFPQQISQAATWNPDLVEQAAAVTAYECRASGIPWNFSPVLDLARQPLWSRFFETYGEDVYLAKRMSAACVKGYQGNDPSDPHKVAACMKHFLGYSMPISGKDRTPAWIPERQLREYFLPTFETAIDNNALTVMINSGEMNGIPVHADHDILTTLLRDELGFKGLAVTDWEDIIKLYRDHKVAENMRDAVKISVLAGIDMSMTPNDYSFNHALIDLVKTGEVPESRLDESCRRILWVKKQLGVLKQPLPNFASYDKFGSEEHREIAFATALESITLLKNEEQTLPLKQDANILVCGPAANSLNILNGAWTHTWQGVDEQYNTKGAHTIYEALTEFSTGKVEYAQGSSLDSLVDLEEAIAKGKKADAIVICLGEIPSTEKPGDIEDLTLPAAQRKLVKELSKLNKPIIFAMVLNRPLIVSEIEPHADAIIHCYLPGDQGADALAKILYGNANPSGKLPFTYPRYTGSFVPYDHKHTEKLDKTFGHAAFNPQWEFGHGLSYSTFEYKAAKLDNEIYSAKDVITLTVVVANVSEVDGKEVIRVFVADEVASITPSVKRLRAFKKVNIKANTSVTIEIEIPVAELAFVNAMNKWEIEPGNFELMVGNISLDFKVK